MNADEMFNFIEQRIRGSKNADVQSFLGDVKKQAEDFLRRQGTQSSQAPIGPATAQRIRTQGQALRANRPADVSARLAGALAVVSGLAFEQTKAVLDVCAEGQSYRNALKALAQGDLEEGKQYLFGSYRYPSKTGIYDELVKRGSGPAALNFVQDLGDVLEEIENDAAIPLDGQN